MHRRYNSDNEGIATGQGMYVAYRRASANTGKDLVRGDEKIREMDLKR